jgi:hypothetical protein
MFIRLASDLHNEIFHKQVDAETEIYEMPEDKDSTLILAGDIFGFKKSETYVEFLKKVCARFKYVVYVAGNHEYYGGSLATGAATFTEEVDKLGLTNFFFLNPGYKVLDGVLFVGGTLWTDYEKMDPLAIMNCEGVLNDFKTIRTGPTSLPYQRKVRATDFFKVHCEHRNYILDVLQNFKNDATITKRVVVTHHGPTWESIDPKFRGHKANGAYVSDLTYFIGDFWPDLWVHGHIHNTIDYMVGDCRVMTNPRGYINPIRFGTFGDKTTVRPGGRENQNYDPLFRVELL